ncbi:MAG: PaaI family thioesterase [Flavobacteriales bacterium]
MTEFSKIKWMLRLLGWFKIPMIGYVHPRLISIDDEKVVVKIKLHRRTKNHLNSMYFGALAVGADVAGGIHAFYYAKRMNKKVSFAFKGMNSNFLKRAEDDVTFESNDGKKVELAIKRSIETKERINEKTLVKCFSKDELIAEFEMIVSVKCY